MTIITDEIVEKAADGALAFIEEWKPYRIAKFKKERPSDYAELKSAFRAALEAIIPDVVEKCRQAVVNQVRLAPAQQQWSAGYDAAIEDASSAIRSLLNKEDKANG